MTHFVRYRYLSNVVETGVQIQIQIQIQIDGLISGTGNVPDMSRMTCDGSDVIRRCCAKHPHN